MYFTFLKAFHLLILSSWVCISGRNYSSSYFKNLIKPEVSAFLPRLFLKLSTIYSYQHNNLLLNAFNAIYTFQDCDRNKEQINHCSVDLLAYLGTTLEHIPKAGRLTTFLEK